MNKAIKEYTGSIAGAAYTPPFRMAFCHLSEPSAPPQIAGQSAPVLKYNLQAVFPDNTDFDSVEKTLTEAAQAKGLRPDLKGLSVPFRPKADKAQYTGYEGNGFFCTLGSEACPQYVNAAGEPVSVDEAQSFFRAGHWAHALVNAYGYTNAVEYFAVMAEYFFEAPDALKKKNPQLYRLLEKMLHQDTASFLPGVTNFRPRRIGRNSPCPCGSGKKYKKCCL